MKSWHISIYLLKRGWQASALERPDTLSKHAVIAGGNHLGDLWVKKSKQKIPTWMSFFESSVRPPVRDLLSSSASAVWLVQVKRRLFAVSFGYGRAFLAPGSCEDDFGLKVTLNCVDIEKVRSVDRLTIDTISRHSQIQASHEARIGEFGLDVEQDLLRAVTGKPIEAKLGNRLTGKDALHVNAKTRLEDMPTLLGRYLEEYRKRDYQRRFPWVDHVREVGDVTTVSTLDGILLRKLEQKDFDKLWLTVPEPIDWGRVSGFKYGTAKKAPLHDDLHIAEWIGEHGDVRGLDIGLLSRLQVVGLSAEDDGFAYRWPLYRCIYCEVSLRGSVYLLNNGMWFRIADDFAKTVDRSFAGMRVPDFDLPDYQDRSEAEYSRRVAESDPRRFALMDQRLVTYPGGVDRLEFCDLYTRNLKIIHIKRYGGSSVLSHLFSQGLVSGETFRRDEGFRRSVDRLLPQTHKLRAAVRNIDASRFEVVFGIVSKSPRPLNIPFFSKVNLRNAERRLSSYGYKVSILKIQAR